MVYKKWKRVSFVREGRDPDTAWPLQSGHEKAFATEQHVLHAFHHFHVKLHRGFEGDKTSAGDFEDLPWSQVALDESTLM
jgi:hypothetical protein